jgi:coenzyme F420-reducing hydrogenase delta subunit
MVIGPPGRAGKDLLAEARDYAERHPPDGARVLVMACAQGLPPAEVTARAPGVQIYPLHCAAAVHTSVMEYLLRKGVGGLYLLACPGRDCAFRFGPRWLSERIYNNREAELRDRVERHRVRIGNFGRSEMAAAVDAIRAFQREIEAAAGRVVAEAQVDLNELCEPSPEKAHAAARK